MGKNLFFKNKKMDSVLPFHVTEEDVAHLDEVVEGKMGAKKNFRYGKVKVKNGEVHVRKDGNEVYQVNEFYQGTKPQNYHEEMDLTFGS